MLFRKSKKRNKDQNNKNKPTIRYKKKKINGLEVFIPRYDDPKNKNKKTAGLFGPTVADSIKDLIDNKDPIKSRFRYPANLMLTIWLATTISDKKFLNSYKTHILQANMLERRFPLWRRLLRRRKFKPVFITHNDQVVPILVRMFPESKPLNMSRKKKPSRKVLALQFIFGVGLIAYYLTFDDLALLNFSLGMIFGACAYSKFDYHLDHVKEKFFRERLEEEKYIQEELRRDKYIEDKILKETRQKRR